MNGDGLSVYVLSSLSASALLTSTPRGVGPPVCVNTDGERRSEDLYLAAVPEERAVVAAVVVPLHLQVEAVLEGVVVGKLKKQKGMLHLLLLLYLT